MVWCGWPNLTYCTILAFKANSYLCFLCLRTAMDLHADHRRTHGTIHTAVTLGVHGHRCIPHVFQSCKIHMNILWILQTAVQCFSDQSLNAIIYTLTCWIIFRYLTGTLSNMPTPTQPPVSFYTGLFLVWMQLRTSCMLLNNKKKSKKKSTSLKAPWNGSQSIFSFCTVTIGI